MLNNERIFWKTLSIAYCFWWVVSLINLLWPFDLWNSTADIITDSTYLFYYMGWFVALSFSPHTNVEQNLLRSDRWLMGAGLAVLAFCLFAYFILVPSRLGSGNPDLWVPSLLFMAGLDCVLMLLLLRFLQETISPRWRVLYLFLLSIVAMYFVLDLLEALHYAELYVWGQFAASEIMWSFPFVALILLARVRNFQFPEDTSSPDVEHSEEARVLTNFSPIMLVAFIMPIVHIILNSFGYLNEDTKRAQGAVVLGSLVLFWTLAILENRSLRRRALVNQAYAEELQQLRDKKNLEEKAEQVKRQFLANVSHEIRTPMNGILGMSEILSKSRLDEKQQNQVELLHSSAQSLLAVIDDILEHSKFSVGEIAIVKRPFNIRVTAEQVVQLTRVAANQKVLDFQLKVGEDIPAQLVGDESRLRQVLINLVNNAVKFTDVGTIIMRFSMLEKANGVARILCEVIDTGIGVEPDFEIEMFRAFTQADTSNSRKYGGSGLGLTISKQIVEAQSGKIGVKANPDGGSIFWFEMPFNLVDESRPKATVAEPSTFSHGNFRILLVEDDLVNQEVLSQQLKYMNLTNIEVAGNGLLAIEALENRQFDLVLMDCQMPLLDGLEATRRIRAKGFSQEKLPIIALTAHAFAEDRERCIDAGMNDFLSKPVKISKLQEMLAQWLPVTGKA